LKSATFSEALYFLLLKARHVEPQRAEQVESAIDDMFSGVYRAKMSQVLATLPD
jgi:hypothetical protein